MPVARLAVATALVVGGALVASAPVAEARYGFKFGPLMGTPKTTFKATFRAPLPVNGIDTDYHLEAIGPRRCLSIFELTGEKPRGRRIVMRLTPADDILIPARTRRRWCRGSYVGFVIYSSLSGTDRVIGSFSFGVGRAPVSLSARNAPLVGFGAIGSVPAPDS